MRETLGHPFRSATVIGRRDHLYLHDKDNIVKSHWIALHFAALSFVVPCALAETSAYAGQEARDIKALAPDEVDAYMAGKGFGLAKAAELNGYAGPAHVLELSEKLALTADQRARTQVLFDSMQAKAVRSGRELVERERRLDAMFSAGTITPDALAKALDEIGHLQAQVRRAHLEAHLAEAKILTPEQNVLYASLRGYGISAEGAQHHQHHPMQ
jgi:Spy/CpxP family protein refolding chaperone